MNNTLSEGNSEVLKPGYVIAIVFAGFVILVFIIAYIISPKKHMDKKINNNTTNFIPPIISLLPTNISKSSYV